MSMMCDLPATVTLSMQLLDNFMFICATYPEHCDKIHDIILSVPKWDESNIDMIYKSLLKCFDQITEIILKD